jgi:hypothetical protein
VTRERWSRTRIESHDPVACPLCRRATNLAFVPMASERTGVNAEDVNRAISSGLLPVWETQTGEALVCLGCLRKLKEEKTI